jgi:hypothetical protein
MSVWLARERTERILTVCSNNPLGLDEACRFVEKWLFEMCDGDWAIHKMERVDLCTVDVTVRSVLPTGSE